MRRSRFVVWLSLLALVALLAATATAAPRGAAPPRPRPPLAHPVGAVFPGVPRVLLEPPSPSVLGLSADSAPRRRLLSSPFSFIDRERMLATLETLTAIGQGSLYRSSGSRGERAAFDQLAAWLGRLPFLAAAGLEIERQPFRLYFATECWEVHLFLDTGQGEVEVPVQALQGNREDLARVARFDTDGAAGDDRRDPREVSGAALVVRTSTELTALTSASVRDRIVLLDYAIVDRSLIASDQALARATALVQKAPAAIVLVTTFSNRAGESHGTMVGDLSAFVNVSAGPAVPVVTARIEDFVPAGVTEWAAVGRIRTARLRLDADIIAPAASQNLVATIPGRDRSHSIILGAHLDSPNTPGALDNGSGSTVLLEVARVLDAARIRPPVDLVLCWTGTHERGLYGSQNFLVTHQELLDRTVAMLQIDCLTRPLDGLRGELLLETWPYGRFGDGRILWRDYLAGAATPLGVAAIPISFYSLASDNTLYSGFDVPNANLIFWDPSSNLEVHYAGHLHDPYDTAALVRDVAVAFEDMARIALVAALETGREAPPLRVTPAPTRRAVFVASHTEPPHMTPASMIDFGMALAWDGFDVDIVPYGQAVTTGDIAGADLVVALPVADYPVADGATSPYDEAWSSDEVAALEEYVADGGFIVLINSARRLKYLNSPYEGNEDTLAANDVAARFGVSWLSGALNATSARTEGNHALVQGSSSLALVAGNAVPYQVASGTVLARAGSQPVATLLRQGSGGEVLVLADLGILGAVDEPVNMRFWRNLAAYARQR